MKILTPHLGIPSYIADNDDDTLTSTQTIFTSQINSLQEWNYLTDG